MCLRLNSPSWRGYCVVVAQLSHSCLEHIAFICSLRIVRGLLTVLGRQNFHPRNLPSPEASVGENRVEIKVADTSDVPFVPVWCWRLIRQWTKLHFLYLRPSYLDKEVTYPSCLFGAVISDPKSQPDIQVWAAGCFNKRKAKSTGESQLDPI